MYVYKFQILSITHKFNNLKFLIKRFNVFWFNIGFLYGIYQNNPAFNRI